MIIFLEIFFIAFLKYRSTLLSIPQRNRTKRGTSLCVCVYVCIYVYREIYFREEL